MSDNDGSDTAPLHHQRAFGAGIKRRRIDFVPASYSEEPLKQSKVSSGERVSNAYLSLVLSKSASAKSADERCDSEVASDNQKDDLTIINASTTFDQQEDAASRAGVFCEDCRRHISEASLKLHMTSISHQLCMSHSHPPSALDRNRKGFSYMSKLGWDPDARKGLGAQGEGRLFPVQAKQRVAGLGIGAEPPGDADTDKTSVNKLNAAQSRIKYQRDKAKAERLQRQFYSSEDVLKRLGEGE